MEQSPLVGTGRCASFPYSLMASNTVATWSDDVPTMVRVEPTPCVICFALVLILIGRVIVENGAGVLDSWGMVRQRTATVSWV